MPNVIFNMSEPLSYKPTDWHNDVTPLNESNLNNIEKGIVQLTETVNRLKDDNNLVLSASNEVDIKASSALKLSKNLDAQINGTSKYTDSVIRLANGLFQYIGEILYRIYGIEWRIVAEFSSNSANSFVGVINQFKFPNSNEYTPVQSDESSIVPINNISNAQPVISTGASENNKLRDDKPYEPDSILGKLDTLMQMFNAYVGENEEFIDKTTGDIMTVEQIFNKLFNDYLTNNDAIDGAINELRELVRWANDHYSDQIDFATDIESLQVKVAKLEESEVIDSEQNKRLDIIEDKLGDMDYISDEWENSNDYVAFKRLSNKTAAIKVKVFEGIPGTVGNELILSQMLPKDFCITEGSHVFPVRMTLTDTTYQTSTEINNIGYISINSKPEVNRGSYVPNIIDSHIDAHVENTINAEINPSKPSSDWLPFGYTHFEGYNPAGGSALLSNLGGKDAILGLTYLNSSDPTSLVSVKQIDDYTYYVGKVCYKGLIYDSTIYDSKISKFEIDAKPYAASGFIFSTKVDDNYIYDVAKFCNYKITSGNGDYFKGLENGVEVSSLSKNYITNLTDTVAVEYNNPIKSRVFDYNWYAFHRNNNTETEPNRTSLWNANSIMSNGLPTGQFYGEVVIDLNEPRTPTAFRVNCMGQMYDWSLSGVSRVEIDATNDSSILNRGYNESSISFIDTYHLSVGNEIGQPILEGNEIIPKGVSKWLEVRTATDAIGSANGPTPVRYIRIRVYSDYPSVDVDENGNPTGYVNTEGWPNWIMINEIEVNDFSREPTEGRKLLTMVFSPTPDFNSDANGNAIDYTYSYSGSNLSDWIELPYQSAGSNDAKYLIGSNFDLRGKVPANATVRLTFDDSSCLEGTVGFYSDLKNNTLYGYIGQVQLEEGSLTGDYTNLSSSVGGKCDYLRGVAWNALRDSKDLIYDVDDYKDEGYLFYMFFPSDYNMNVNAFKPTKVEIIPNADSSSGDETSTTTGFISVSTGNVTLISNLDMTGKTISNIDTSSVYYTKSEI